MPLLHILWDDSHIWGLLAVRAARAMGVPYRLVWGGEIAGGLLERERPSLLFVPGGNARHKAETLTQRGISAVRAYVAGGGSYLGFCGGAGLALGWEGGLGLCPWQRASFDERLQHFMSGHLHMRLAGDHALRMPEGLPGEATLPVWWPGRFAPEEGDAVAVLASYERPGEDFWLADLPVADLPGGIFATWRERYGLSFSPAFLAGQPCVVSGEYGNGRYVLSYSHLETPASPHANRWLAHLLRVLGAFVPSRELLPPWTPREQEVRWHDPDLERLDRLLADLLHTGVRHGQLFYRNDWLMGWRTGIPGANLNNLWSVLAEIRAAAPNEAALHCWRERRNALLETAERFCAGCTEYLLAERLAMTLAKSLPDALPPALLKAQRESLFGPPMQPGGLYKEIMRSLDELVVLQLS